jgi:hypothetical protein
VPTQNTATTHRPTEPTPLVNLFDILTRHGTLALARFVGALMLFLVLHLARLPLLVAVRVLEAAMRRINTYATTLAPSPITARQEEDHVHAYAT